MTELERTLRIHARTIWDAAVAAANPQVLVGGADFSGIDNTERILVVGGGKAGAAMAAGLETAIVDHLDRVEGIVNVPGEHGRSLATHTIRLHTARPAGNNHPTAEGVVGTGQMLDLLANAGPKDVAICLLSGGGSALLPAPATGVSLEDKQAVTKILHASGATINEMNAVRKHLSRVKGGGMVRAFRGRKLISLIISDVVGDPLDVIASGPTAADPTTFADAIAILKRFDLWEQSPLAIRDHLERGHRGESDETLKVLPSNVENRIIGNNARSLRASQAEAERLGYRVLNLGSYIEGETRIVAETIAGVIRSIVRDRIPVPPPACILIGGETTVTLGSNPGKGGRNQEFVLATLLKLTAAEIDTVVVLSGGTDGEDGPTDAAGAVTGGPSFATAMRSHPEFTTYLNQHDAYPLFDATGGLIQTGLTGTNVMDVRVILIG